MKIFIYKLKNKFNRKQNLKSNGKRFAMPFCSAGMNLVSGINMNTKKLLLIIIFLLSFFGLSDKALALSGNRPPVPDARISSTNVHPTTNVEYIDEVVEGSKIYLWGEDSFDLDGGSFSYSWSCSGGQIIGSSNSANSANAVLRVSDHINLAVTYSCELKTHEGAADDSALIDVVNFKIASPNSPPIGNQYRTSIADARVSSTNVHPTANVEYIEVKESELSNLYIWGQDSFNTYPPNGPSIWWDCNYGNGNCGFGFGESQQQFDTTIGSFGVDRNRLVSVQLSRGDNVVFPYSPPSLDYLYISIIDDVPSSASPGDINVKVTLDGIPWSGALFYSLGGPNGSVNSDMMVPHLHSNLPSGIYTISYVTWGPQETIPPTTITPVSSQVLPGGSAIEFVLNFKSICNDGIDNDSDGKIDFPKDPGCMSYTDPGEEDFNFLQVFKNTTSPPSGGTVTGAAGFDCGVNAVDCTTSVPVVPDVPGINCGTNCYEYYYKGTTVVLTATSDANSNFIGWSDGGGYDACNSVSGNTCTVIIDKDMFEKGGYKILASFVPKVQCSDGIDNDGDGKTDYPNDKGCENSTDDTETIVLSCLASPPIVQTEQTVTWTANPSSGQTPYSYSWSGAVSGNTQSVQTSYPTTGTKTANVSVSSGTESKSASCSVNVVPQNSIPIAVSGISLDTTTFNSIINVKKGVATTFYLSSWKGTQSSPTSKSDDPDGWTNPILGMLPPPARCEWDTDLVQDAASFATNVQRAILPNFGECSDPDNNASNYLTLTKTFNDTPGTYTYYVLKMTDRAGGASNPLGTVQVKVLAQCEDGIDNDGDGKIDYPADAGCSSSDDNDETDVPGSLPVPPGPPGGGLPSTSPVCVASNNSDIVLNWTYNSNNEDGFKIYRGVTSTFTPTDPPLITTPPNTTTATDASPVTGVSYYYKIAAYNSAGNSPYLTLGPVTADSCAPTFVIIDSSGDANSTIEINETEQYDGKYDSDGPGGSAPETTISRPSITWVSLNTTIATVNGTGKAKGEAFGSTKIQGTYSAITAEANITIAACSNDCSPSGTTLCQGNSVITCGDYDPDSCLEWSSPPTPCGAGLTCVSGSCVAAPAITFTASPSTIKQGESTVLSWNATNVDSCVASGGWEGDWSGSKPISSASVPISDRTVSPKRTSSYTLTCVNTSTGTPVSETRQIVVKVVVDIRPK